jgi:hypothetical protein
MGVNNCFADLKSHMDEPLSQNDFTTALLAKIRQ